MRGIGRAEGRFRSESGADRIFGSAWGRERERGGIGLRKYFFAFPENERFPYRGSVTPQQNDKTNFTKNFFH